MRRLALFFLALGLASCPSGGGTASSEPSILAGSTHSCALASSGEVHCWGSGLFNHLGYGSRDDRLTPGEAIPGLSGVIQISTRNRHSCALVRSGRVHCWGTGNNGRLGYGNASHRLSPGEVIPGISSVVQISAGGSHTCALVSSGRVHCWGWGDSDRLGYGGNTTSRTVPGQAIPGLTDVIQIVAGNDFTCSLQSSGGAHCWGEGSSGQLGYGNTSNRDSPGEAIPNLNGVRQISLGDDHTCALTEGGSVHCWGWGNSGRLGYGNDTDRSTPGEAIPDLSNVRRISAGGSHTCALTGSGNVHCWGVGLNGRLGYGNGSTRLSPGETIPGLSGVRQISAGNAHTCVVVESGRAHCWGDGGDGDLGYGNRSDRLAPGEPIPSFSLFR